MSCRKFKHNTIMTRQRSRELEDVEYSLVREKKVTLIGYIILTACKMYCFLHLQTASDFTAWSSAILKVDTILKSSKMAKKFQQISRPPNANVGQPAQKRHVWMTNVNAEPTNPAVNTSAKSMQRRYRSKHNQNGTK